MAKLYQHVRTRAICCAVVLLAACGSKHEEPVARAPATTTATPNVAPKPPPTPAPEAEIPPAVPTLDKLAPEIIGEDIDGKPIKLSDYRGRVVMLDFWGNWRPPCRAMYASERSLVKRLEKEPFALLGVNSDSDREALKKVIAKERITWRSFWNGGGKQGPISKAWKVRGWPTIYVIDADGIIRFKTEGADEAGTEKAIEECLERLKVKSKR